MNEFLKSKGYIGPIPDPAYPENCIYWYRKIPGTERHQFVVKQWDMRICGVQHFSYEVQTAYETIGKIWSESKFYGVNENDLKLNLERFESRLRQIIAYMDGNPLHYRYDGKD